jgi:hypothetical protein
MRLALIGAGTLLFSGSGAADPTQVQATPSLGRRARGDCATKTPTAMSSSVPEEPTAAPTPVPSR